MLLRRWTDSQGSDYQLEVGRLKVSFNILIMWVVLENWFYISFYKFHSVQRKLWGLTTPRHAHPD